MSVSNDELKAALLAYIRTKTTLTNEMVALGTGSQEIRENQWQGQDFEYPAVRIRGISNVPSNDNCSRNNVTFSWGVFTEDQSSLDCDRLCGIISDIFHQKNFIQAGIQFSTRVTNVIPAIRTNTTTWRGEVLCQAWVNG